MINYEIKRIELELTNSCNLKCPLCIRQTHPEFIGNIKYRELNDIIEQLDSFKALKYVTLAGPASEPTLYPKLFELIKYLISRDIEISLFINGDTHDDMYYRKLGLLFNRANGHIYFTVCGTTQELHSKYRVGSNLETVLKRYKIIETYSKKAMLNYIVFNYNEDDYKNNFYKFKLYKTEAFYTLPVNEHYNLNNDIHLPDRLVEEYQKIDKNDKNDFNICPAELCGFALISVDGSINKCSLLKQFGTSHCFECSLNNSKILKQNKIYRLAEPEDETSELDLHLN